MSGNNNGQDAFELATKAKDEVAQGQKDRVCQQYGPFLALDCFSARDLTAPRQLVQGITTARGSPPN